MMEPERFGAKRRPIATWLAIGLLALALIPWTLVRLSGGARSTAPKVASENTWAATVLKDTLPGAPPAVNEYLIFVALQEGTTDANHSHAYTADGLRRLAAALSALLQLDPGASASQRMQIESLRRRADDLQRDPASLKHAEFARGAFTTAVEVSRWIQERSVPAAAEEVTALRAAALALDPGIPLLQQTSAVARYFDRAGAVVRSLTTRRGTDGGRMT